jgi:hypothetical protein
MGTERTLFARVLCLVLHQGSGSGHDEVGLVALEAIIGSKALTDHIEADLVA